VEEPSSSSSSSHGGGKEDLLDLEGLDVAMVLEKGEVLLAYGNEVRRRRKWI